MQTKSVFFIVITALLLSGGCVPKESSDLKMTIEPQSGLYSDKFFNFGETGDIITKRLMNLGIDSENIDIRTFTDRLILTVTDFDTSMTEIITKLITVHGKIEFWETYENSEIIPFLSEANTLLGDMHVNIGDLDITQNVPESNVVDTTNADAVTFQELIEEDTAGTASLKAFKLTNPLFGIMRPNVDGYGKAMPSCMIGLVTITDTAKVNSYLNMSEIKSIFPRDLRFCWSKNPYEWDDSKTIYELHAIKVTSILGEAPIDGSVIVSAKPVPNKSGINAEISFSMNAEGAKMWARMTRDNIDRCIAVVIDDYVRSYPRVATEITGGNSNITGNFSLSEARYLSAIFSSGRNRIPLKLQVTDRQIIQKEK